MVTKKELNKKIGQRTIAMRQQRGWSQLDLARASFKDRQAIHKLENGNVNHTIYTLWEISKAFNVSLRDFLDF